MAAPTLRNARSDDYARFAELFRELGLADDPVPTAERFAADMVASTLIAEQDGRAVGYAFFRTMTDTVHLAHLVSAPEVRRSGVGRSLMNEVTRRARAAGCTHLALNVRAENTAAIRLYESFGLAATHRNHGLKMPWTVVESRREAATLVDRVREVDAAEDAELEMRCGVTRGTLAEQRARPGRVIRAITTEPDAIALAVFDVGFPGTYPFRAPDLRHAWSLLLALRPFARPEDADVHVLVEAHPELAAGLVAAGATLKIEAVFMRGPI